ncbi:porin [Bradyrhizobium sp. B097]|uniref:porin n=1 Tax=Bradyrhizobium sp. B097 TaxID=3140244 RepID=UPI003183534F
MKMVKSLILGSAAALAAVGGAQAADLPVKAKAVEYVKVCSLYGPGFYYIPGTDTCIKLGGYLRMDVLANTNSDNTGNTSGAGGAQNRFTNGYTWRSREDLNIDTRTATEYGVVRTFFDATFSWTSDTYAGQGTGATVYSPIGTAQAPNNANSGAVAGGTVGVYYAFIQFAGFTMGKAVSQFSAPWANYPGNNYDGLVGGGGTITGVNQFTYTAQFGNGVSLSLSAQDQTQYYQAGVANLGALSPIGAAIGATGPFGASDYAGTVAPDFVAMLRVDQAWGLFQASFAAHDNHAAYYGGTELTGHPDDKWGWAGQLALSIKNIPTGPGDTINMQGVYTDGATRYNIQDLAGSAGANTIYGGTNLAGAYQSVAFGIAPDSVFATGTQQQLVKTWGFRGAYVHNWNPYWNTSIYGAYAGIMYNDTAKVLICGIGGVGGSLRSALAPAGSGAAITTCNPDYNIAQIGTQTQWTPVKNLTFSADFTYTHLDQKAAGTVVAPSTPIGKPAALYELKDQNTVLLMLRAQRNW